MNLMKTTLVRTCLAAGACLGLASAAVADTQTVSGNAMFTSDLQNTMDIVLPQFDPALGTLTAVQVTVEHTGGADFAADNDDEFQGTGVRARVIRDWAITGPDGFSSGAFRQLQEPALPAPAIALAIDDGDGGNNDTFDATPPDGFNFGTVSYGPDISDDFAAALAPYTGPGTVTFSVDAILKINDLQFSPQAPDAWQLDVQNPFLDVIVTIEYTFDPVGACCLPAPGGGAPVFICNELTEADCDAAGGTFFAGIPCSPELCDQPVGACCLPDDSCIDGVTAAGCNDLNGTFYGVGSVCSNINCDTPDNECNADVPTVGEWGLIIMGLSFLTGGTLVIRRGTLGAVRA